MVLVPDRTAAAVDGAVGGLVTVSTGPGIASFCVSGRELVPVDVKWLVSSNEGVLVNRRLGAELEAEGKSVLLAMAARIIRLPALSCLTVSRLCRRL